ncbi:MAG: amino acid adenylation domain-containing protein, partial [Acidobacteriota bacterium]
GGAYLPLDPGDPAERVAFMLADAQAPILLTEQRQAGTVSAEQVLVLCLDSEWEQITDQDEEPAAHAASAGNLAYVIYTSGSTGRPKGVSVEHQALINLVAWHQRAYDVQPSDRATLVAGQAFDASVWELWPYLTAGASIHIPDEETRSSPPALIQWLETQAITLCFLPTPLAEAALAEQWPAQMPLRCLLTGGDRLHRRPGQELPFSFFNHYGPTENTVVATATRIAPGEGATLPIGRPIAGTQVYLLDAHLQPVPIGVAGELCIGGAGLARGYLNRPDLTAASFVPHPYSDEPGMRLYRTGDRARYMTDGQIEFLGRGDNQVKVRGFRIEFGEIEAALCQHEAVREAAVLAREDVPGKKRLVAYVVAAREEVGAAELIAYLKKKLPDYMVPTSFLLLDELPLTRHGKVDRRNLPQPDSAARTPEQALAAPRTAVEWQLAEIWSQVLGVARVGIHDNFFELGGDSILSIQIIARANKAGLRLVPKQIFQHQTIAELAAVSGSGETVRADQGTVTGDVPLIPIQHWFFEQNLPDVHHFNQSLLIELRAGIEPQVLERAVRQVFAHHDALRLRFTRAGANWLQSHATDLNDDGHGIFTHCDISALTKNERGDAVAATSAAMQESLDLSGGPLARVVLFDSGAEEPKQLLIIIHHLVIDGVSWRILLEDLHAAYEQVSRDGHAELPAKTTSFKQWAEQLVEYARSEKLAEEVEYWTADARTRVRSLPLDHIGGTNTVAAARSVEVSLSVAETRALLQEVPAAYRLQINDVLLTALTLAFCEWTGERRLLVDLEGHGREELFGGSDLSRTVGWFTTICPVLLDLEAADTVADAISSVKEKLRHLPSRGLGYGLLRYLRGDDSVAAQLRMLPQAEVSFNYLGQLDQTMSAASLFASAKPAAGWGRSPRAPRRYLFEISGGVAEGQLTLTWQFGGEQFEPATVEKLAAAYVAALRAIITHCTSSAAPGYTPSDFPLAQLDQKKLDWPASARRQLEDISPQPPPLEPAPRNGSLPVSFAQEPMWQLDQMLPGNPFFNVPAAFRMSGALNLAVLERSLAEITQRHEVLRTTFAEVDGSPVQIIAEESPAILKLIDLRELPSPEREVEALRLATADARRYFDLARGPLVRINLLRLDEEEYRALVTMHHIIADAWSIGVFVRELAILYEAFLHERPSPLPELPVQYADYANWQRQWLQGEALENELAFWREQLSGSFGSLNLPDGSPHSEALTFQTALRRVTLPRALSVAISESNRAEGVTLFMTLLTGLQILLHRRSGQQDVRVGTLVANRNCVETEAMIGLFVNTLVIRSFLSTDLTYRQAIRQVRETVLGAFNHQDIPFELLLQELEREREMERTTLVEVLFILQNAPMQPLELQDLTVSPLEEDGTAAESEVTLTSFDLVLMMWEGPDGLAGSLRYKTGIFDEAMINRLLEDYQNILATIALHPSQRITAKLESELM